MKPSALYVTVALIAGLVSACSTPDRRIHGHEATFNSLSAEDQGKIRGGIVDVGYTQEMVLMALGDPDRRYTRTTAEGSTEVWAYRDRSPRVSIGFGVAGGSGGTGMGAGLGVSSGGDRRDDRVRVIFKGNRVNAIERRGS